MHKTSTAVKRPGLSRRVFLGTSAVAAGGLVVGFHVPFANVANAQAAASGTAA